MIKAIFAIDINGGMGNKGSLPWPYDAEDMRWFKSHTENQVVIMGSGTWLDPNMPSPLPNRINVVISSQNPDKFLGANHVIKTDDLNTALHEIELQYKDKSCWIIGGSKLLSTTRHLITDAYITHYQSEYTCDVTLDITTWLKNTIIQEESYGRNKIFRRYVCTRI